MTSCTVSSRKENKYLHHKTFLLFQSPVKRESNTCVLGSNVVFYDRFILTAAKEYVKICIVFPHLVSMLFEEKKCC